MSARNLSKLSAMQNKTVRSYTAMTFPKEKNRHTYTTYSDLSCMSGIYDIQAKQARQYRPLPTA